MTRGEIRKAIRQYLAVVEGVEPIEDRERALRLSLDRLALAYHFAEAPADPRDAETADDARDSPDAPRPEGRVLLERIRALFPDYGFYNDILNITGVVGAPEFGVGDALDDLTDIALEMYRVLARWRTSEEDALFAFRTSFFHWGDHLRSLQRYLHEREF